MTSSFAEIVEKRIQSQVELKTQDIIRSCSQIVFEAAANMIYRDPHSWSTRPCQTCRGILEMMGVDFGCARYAKEKK